jgi:nucleotide-binding universal stress UspA family protein
MAPFRRIMHATDFSSNAMPALRQAVALARRWRARVILLHVMTPPSPFVSEGIPPSSYDELLAHARRATKRHLAALLSRVRRKGVQASAVLVEGLPAEEICAPLGASAQISSSSALTAARASAAH